jgi:hypothetical protein
MFLGATDPFETQFSATQTLGACPVPDTTASQYYFYKFMPEVHNISEELKKKKHHFYPVET